MNQGGEQGHDDYGLPRVDIEIPDDARELYRDVQAYHRELRAIRRHQRSMRWRAPFRRTGIAVPLLAGSLIIALLAVMVSAMLTVNPYLTGQRPGRSASGSAKGTSNSVTTPGQPGQSSSGRRASPSPGGGSAAARLPGKTISVAGKPLPLRTLRSTALAIIPANCRCDAAVRSLLRQAQSAGVLVYLVGSRGSDAMLKRLANLVAATRPTQVATDDADVLTDAYQRTGFTVLLVDSHGAVTVAAKLGPRLMLEPQLRQLKPAS